jgi:DNA-binding transcriptional regulator YdaS (Cro superfamily)
MSRELIEAAVTLLGSQAKLAEACGVKQQSIWQAKETGRCSAELALQIEQATAGKVTAAELRPDLPWPLAPPAAPSAEPVETEGVEQ